MPIRETEQGAPWMRLVLLLAAFYNVAWGAWVVADPAAIFRLTGLEPPTYPQIWQCVGMIVGVYGLGYGFAARAPLRHWPIILVGLLGKIFGPLGFAAAAIRGELPSSWGWIILANHLIWWAPFAESGDRTRPSVSLALRMARSQTGESLLSLSRRQPRLVVCLRHLGCTFCRESLDDLSRVRSEIEAAGTGVVLVHPASDEERADALFAGYGLDDLPRVADPERVLYRALGLERGSWLAVLGPRVFWRAGVAALRGHRPSRAGGDVWQMPGVFLIHDGRIVEAFRHVSVDERPDYQRIARRLQDRLGDASGASTRGAG